MWTFPLALMLLAAQAASLPPVSVQTQSGGRLDLAAWRGHPVVVVFWATWCEPCRQELAALERISAHPDAKHRVLAIATDAQGWKTVLPFIREQGHTLPFALLTPAVARAFRLPPSQITVPQTLFFDRRGRLAARYGEMLPRERLASLIESLISLQDERKASDRETLSQGASDERAGRAGIRQAQ
jgi:thiol-disulfide isomerase/thioredoxin